MRKPTRLSIRGGAFIRDKMMQCRQFARKRVEGLYSEEGVIARHHSNFIPKGEVALSGPFHGGFGGFGRTAPLPGEVSYNFHHILVDARGVTRREVRS